MKSHFIIPLSLFFYLTLQSMLLSADLTVFAGFQNPGELTVNNVTRNPNSGAVMGGRISFGNLFGFEQTFAYSPNFLESGNHSFNAQSNLIVGVPVGHIRPYATAGIGLITNSQSLFAFNDLGTRFTVNYGGGVKIRNIAGPLGVRFDVRGYSVPDVFAQTLNFIEASIGIMLSW